MLYDLATQSVILKLELTGNQLNITLDFNTIMMGVGKVRKFCAHVKMIKVILMIFFWNIRNKEKHEHVKVKVTLLCIPLEYINYSRKNLSISLVIERTLLKYTPLVIAGYSHLIHMSTLDTNSLLINIKGTTMKLCKRNTYKMCFRKGYNLQFGYNLHVGIGFRGYRQDK